MLVIAQAAVDIKRLQDLCMVRAGIIVGAEVSETPALLNSIFYSPSGSFGSSAEVPNWRCVTTQPFTQRSNFSPRTVTLTAKWRD